MAKLKTIKKLNNQAWYRLLKVLYILAYVVVLLIAIAFVYDTNQPYTRVNQDATTIKCNYGNKKTFTAVEAVVYFTPENFNKSDLSDLTFLTDSEKVRLQYVCEISKEELQSGLNEISATGNTTKLFDVTPSIETGGGWAQVIIYGLITFVIISAVFEALKKIFYYVILGSLFPKKTTENE